MAHHLDLLPCVGMSRAERRQERNQRLLMKRAYNAARLKFESEERRLDRILEEDDERYFSLIPDRDYIPTYFLEERSDWMREAGLRYRYGVPMDHGNPEIMLQVWKRDPDCGEELFECVAGDLYTLTAMAPCGSGTVSLSLIVESSESRQSSNSWLQYSVFDIGCQEKAFAIPGEAWFTYMMWREDDPSRRRELDTRLLFLAVGDYSQLGNGCTVDHFRQFTVDDVSFLIQNMQVGKVYSRPTSAEALLSTDQGGAIELLRSDPDSFDTMHAHLMEDSVEDADEDLLCLADVFKGLAVTSGAKEEFNEGFSETGLVDHVKKVKTKEPAFKQPRVEIDLEDEKSKAIMDLLTQCVDPPEEEKLVIGDLRRSVREIRNLETPRRMDFSEAEVNRIQRGKKKMARRKLSKDRRYAESELEDRKEKLKEKEESENEKKEGWAASSPKGKETSSSGSATKIPAPQLGSFKFVTFIDDLGLIEAIEVPGEMSCFTKERAKPQATNAELNPAKTVRDIIPEEEIWDSDDSDVMPDLEDKEVTDEEEVLSDISYLFNDSLEIFLAKPVNESQVLTIKTSESSVTDYDPEEHMEHTSCESCDAASRDNIADEDLEEDDSPFKSQ